MSYELFIYFATDLAALFGIYLVLNISLNIERGLAGIPNFGLLFSYAGGAYITGHLATKTALLLTGTRVDVDPITNPVPALAAVNPILASSPLISVAVLLVLLMVAGLFGGLLGLIQLGPVIRLREDYLAIALLALAEVMNYIAIAYKPLINGSLGVQVPDLFSWLGARHRFFLATATILLVALVVYLYAEYLGKSPLGRTLRAIRDNEIAAQSLGKSLVYYRAVAMLIGSMLTGIAGALWTLYSGAITPSLTRFEWTFLPWLIIFLGGIGNNRGVVLGTLIYVLVNRLIVYNKHILAGILPFDIVWFDYISLGIVMGLILIYLPQGILPERPKISREIRRLILERLSPR